MALNRGMDAFRDFIANKSISLIGIGISNLPLIPFLYENGANKIICRDLKLSPDSENAKAAVSFGAELICGNEYLSDLQEDIIIRSPVIRPDKPELTEAIANGSLLFTETELFLKFSEITTIGITGSDGKTTTTTLISEILKDAGYNVLLGGNIGKNMLSMLPDAHGEKSIAVIELSSFQLMNSNTSPDISVITNIAENHLDWHKDFNEYISAKQNITKFQSGKSICILNHSNAITKNIVSNAKIRYFGYEIPNGDGAFFKDDTIYYKRSDSIFMIIDRKDILIPGKHNIENYMAAISAVYDFVSIENIKNVAENFKGVKHRIEFIREINGVKYYNSSIDSSPSRTKAALNSFEENKKIVLICGGYDKQLDYSSLGDLIIKKCKCAVLCGATSEKIKDSITSSKLYDEKVFKIIETDSFSDAIYSAKASANSGDIVLLSSASASFDMFNNFEERGELFRKIVMEIK